MYMQCMPSCAHVNLAVLYVHVHVKDFSIHRCTVKYTILYIVDKIIAIMVIS